VLWTLLRLAFEGQVVSLSSAPHIWRWWQQREACGDMVQGADGASTAALITSQVYRNLCPVDTAWHPKPGRPTSTTYPHLAAMGLHSMMKGSPHRACL
jgi:hypothetical protein